MIQYFLKVFLQMLQSFVVKCATRILRIEVISHQNKLPRSLQDAPELFISAPLWIFRAG